jgi:ribosomal protein S18 acetylase RimI-like enzyme
MRIAPIDLGDHATCTAAWRVQRAAYEAEAALIGSRGMQALHETIEELAANTTEAFEGCWIGSESGGVLVGVIATEEEGVRSMLISRLAVDPAFARRGVGRALVARVIERTRAGSSLVSLRVSTGEANHPARRLYESLGFVVEEERVAPDGTRLVVSRLRSSKND